MIIEMIQYKLADGITEDFLRDAATDILAVWMHKQDGFIKWEISKDATGDAYTDFVYWESAAHADAATKTMDEIPKDHNWLTCYDMTSVTSRRMETIFASRM